MADLGNPFRLRGGPGGDSPEDPPPEDPPRDRAEGGLREPARLVARASRGSALAAALGAAQAAGPSDEQLRALEARVLAGVGVATTIAAASVVAANQGTQAAVGVGHAWLAAVPGKIAVGLVVAAMGAGGTIVALKRGAERPPHESAASPALRGAPARTRSPLAEPLVAPAAPATRLAPETLAREEQPLGGPPPLDPAAVSVPATRPAAEATAPSTTPGRRAVSSRAAANARSAPIAELRLLELADRSVETDPALALRLAEQHTRRFPGGVLGDERAVIEIAALARLGRTDEARARASAFLRAHPGSAYSAKVRTLTKLDEARR